MGAAQSGLAVSRLKAAWLLTATTAPSYLASRPICLLERKSLLRIQGHEQRRRHRPTATSATPAHSEL